MYSKCYEQIQTIGMNDSADIENPETIINTYIWNNNYYSKQKLCIQYPAGITMLIRPYGKILFFNFSCHISANLFIE